MKCKKISIVILVFVFVFIFLISSYILLKDMNELRKNNEATEELIEETIEIKEASKEKYIDWNYLKSINEDIIAWIEIEGTNINYPIIKNENNYYLKRSFDKKYNSNGAIFTTNIFPFKDDETIVYGHNMKNGSMFSNLGKYLNKEFLDLHSKYKIYTVDKNYEATIFSVYSIGVNEEMQNLKLLNFDERVKYYKNISKYKIEYNENINKIVKLSTCSYLNAKTRPTDQRYYIIASLNPI